jgi:H+-transporting ATPase
VRVLLVTGDGEATAQAVAARVGLKGDVAPAGTIGKGLDADAIARFGIFARVLPENKFALVEALQKAGHVVGMTGDGVNDAPALRQADIGIATANATDVAKASASLVLTRPGLGEITMAIDGSRQIFQRLQTFISAMTTMKMANPTFYSLGVVVFGAFVVSPLLMVLFMLAADIAFVALSMDRVVPSQRPNRWALGPLMATSLGRSLVLLIFSTAVFVAGQRLLGLTIDQTQTLVFIWLVFSAQAVLYSTRLASFCWHKPYPARPLWLASTLDVVVVTLMATLGILMVPIPPSFVAGALALAVCLLILVDLLKVGVGHLTAKPIYARD